MITINPYEESINHTIIKQKKFALFLIWLATMTYKDLWNGVRYARYEAWINDNLPVLFTMAL